MTTPSPFFTKPVLLNAESQIVQWCIKQGKTVINGSDMYTGKVVADSLTGNILKSTEYSGPDGTTGNCGYSTTGSLFNLATGALSSKNFYIDTNGNATFNGNITAKEGWIGGTSGLKILETGVKYIGDGTEGNPVFYMGAPKQYYKASTNLETPTCSVLDTNPYLVFKVSDSLAITRYGQIYLGNGKIGSGARKWIIGGDGENAWLYTDDQSIANTGNLLALDNKAYFGTNGLSFSYSQGSATGAQYSTAVGATGVVIQGWQNTSQ
jgi:hypothetical protein